jgi:hypothetical protein
MTRLEWNRPQDQTFEAGLDHGVIYVEDGPAVSWSGLTSVDDAGEGTLEEFYIDGIKYLAWVSPRDWKGKLVAYTYPEEFGEMIGMAELGDGFYVDGQPPQRFGLSYRTMVSTPGVDNKQHYKIHLVYKVMASFLGFTNSSLTGDAVDPTSFEFDLAAVPIQVPGHRPSAHVVLDTSKMDSTAIAQIEAMIYGSSDQAPRMPTIEELEDLLKYGDDVTVVYNNDGTWTATGSKKNVRLVDLKGGFEIDNVIAEYLTPEIYEFFGTSTESPNIILTDTDGVYYRAPGPGTPNFGIDTDGIPYFELGLSAGELLTDTDGQMYFEISSSPLVPSITTDTDGVPYYPIGSNIPNISLDTDGVPYFTDTSADSEIDNDEDGIPFVREED